MNVLQGNRNDSGGVKRHLRIKRVLLTRCRLPTTFHLRLGGGVYRRQGDRQGW